MWTDDRIRASAEFDDAIEQELDAARCVVVVWSRASVASGWVRAEASAADEQGKLVPIRFEPDVVPPLRFRQLNTATIQTAALSEAAGGALGMLAEVSRLTGRAPASIDPALLEGRIEGGASGGKTVTPGKWLLTFRLLRARGRLTIDLHPNGTASATGKWLFTRSSLAGRWSFDAALQVLQLEMAGPTTEGLEVNRIEILEWASDHVAVGRFQRRTCSLERLTG